MPATAVYRPLVEAAGLEVTRLDLVLRDVAHDGAEGLAGWMRTTWMPYTDHLGPPRRLDRRGGGRLRGAGSAGRAGQAARAVVPDRAGSDPSGLTRA